MAWTSGQIPNLNIPIAEETKDSFGKVTYKMRHVWYDYFISLSEAAETLSGVAVGGDLSGTLPNPTVAKINGVSLGTTTATSGNILIANGATWATQALSGDATINSSGVITLANTAVTPASYTVNGAAIFTVDSKGRLTSASSPVITVTGTADKITVTGGTGTSPTITVAATYVGQSTITTLGTIATGVWNGTVIVTTYGGTGLSSYTQGDILYYSSGTTLSKLAKDTNATRYLSNTGTDNNPAWAQVAIDTGVSGLGSGVATWLATPSSANLASAVTGETGSGALVFATSPTLVTPLLGTPTSGTLTNCTGLPIVAGTTGTLDVNRGGTGQTSYTNGQLLIGNTTGNTLTKATLTAGTNITITNGGGSITIDSTASGGDSSLRRTFAFMGS